MCEHWAKHKHLSVYCVRAHDRISSATWSKCGTLMVVKVDVTTLPPTHDLTTLNWPGCTCFAANSSLMYIQYYLIEIVDTIGLCYLFYPAWKNWVIETEIILLINCSIVISTSDSWPGHLELWLFFTHELRPLILPHLILEPDLLPIFSEKCRIELMQFAKTKKTYNISVKIASDLLFEIKFSFKDDLWTINCNGSSILKN